MVHHLYLHQEVNEEIVRELVEKIYAINEEYLDKVDDIHNYLEGELSRGVLEVTGDVYFNNPRDEKILLHINSAGGEVHSGLALINAIRSSEVPVETICEGSAMSMAFAIFLSGEKRYGYESSVYMYHPISYGVYDNLPNHKKQLVHSNRLAELYINEVENNTLLTREWLESNEEDYYWYGCDDDAYEDGIVDIVLDYIDKIFDGNCELCDECDSSCN